MPTFIQEGFRKTSRRRTRRSGGKRKRKLASTYVSRTSKAMGDSMRFPMAMASVGAGIAAFKAVTS